jgi:tRNA threonylcarbamoyladenosine biosynthesis protein TsaB
MLLAIDTATCVMSLALHDGDSLLAEQSWHSHNRHTVELTPAVEKLLATCDAAIADLTALAVSTGPGSYTGLRIGVALAKGIAAARSLPLVGVTTLDTLAAGQPYFQSGSGLVAVVQAGRGRIIIKTYRWRKGRWSSHADPRLMDWDTLLSSIDGPAYITGEVDERGRAVIADARAREIPVNIAPPAHRLRRAGFLAETAWERLREAGEDRSAYEAARLAPVYVKSDSDL